MSEWTSVEDSAAKRYADLLEQWEEDAYRGKYGCDWLEEVGEAVKFYAIECAVKGKSPTFKGLMKHIQSKTLNAPNGGLT